VKSRSRSSPGRSAEALAWRQAAQAILQPLVGALLARGLRYADLTDVLDQVIFDAIETGAANPAALPPAKRRRVRARAGASGEALPFSYAAGTRLITRWLTGAAFTANGTPRTLPLEGTDSFATLAQMANSDPVVARRELQRLGVIRVNAGQVTLLADAYVPQRGAIEKLDILGRDGAEFLRAMIHNVSAAPNKTVLQRKASYDHVGSEALPELERLLRTHGMEALLAANEKLAAVDRDRNPQAPAGRRTRVSFGVYYFTEPVSSGKAKSGRRTRPRRKP
jgi:hypothetical protein